MEQRRREIGVRAALGAQRHQLVQLVLGGGLRLVGLGLALGLAASVAGTRSLSPFLEGIEAYDPVTFVTVPAVLMVVALLAAAVPAHRAVRLDPIRALREE